VSHYPSVSHYPHYADLLLKKKIIIINVENSSAASYFCGNHNTFSSLKNPENKKEKHLFETEFFYNILHVFTVTFDRFNAPSVNKSINS